METKSCIQCVSRGYIHLDIDLIEEIQKDKNKFLKTTDRRRSVSQSNTWPRAVDAAVLDAFAIYKNGTIEVPDNPDRNHG